MPRFNRAYRGLYGNRMIQFGNKVSFAENKTRRTWKPNVQKTSLCSEALQKKLQFRITTHALRCVRKAGGLDEYLLKTKDTEIKYPRAVEYKRQIKLIRSGVPLAEVLSQAAEPETDAKRPLRASRPARSLAGLQQLL